MGLALVHFEIPADDPEKVSGFYERVLGWEVGPPQPEFGDYRTVKTSDEPGAVMGGIFKREREDQQPTDYYQAEPIEYHIDEVRKFGGRVLIDKMAVPGMGYLAICADPEGNVFGFWQTDETAGQ